MSLILEALKKSEAERRLGEAPHLGTLPVRSPHAETSSIGWALLVLALVIAAAIWHNRDLLRSSHPEEADDGLLTATQPPPAQQVDAMLLPTAAVPVTHKTVRTQKLAGNAQKPQIHATEPGIEVNAAARGAQASSTAALPMPSPLPAPLTTADRRAFKPEGAPSAVNPEPPHLAQPVASTTASTDTTPTASAMSVNPATAAKDRGAESAAAPEAATLLPTPSAVPAMVTASTLIDPKAEPSTPTQPLIYDLTLGQRQGLPALKMSMHVYHRDRDHRFVIIDGQRVNEDGVLGNQLWVREIRPDGALLEYRGIRFLLPRVGG